MSKICLIYANCQGWALGHFLNKNLFFQADYKIEYLVNYLMINQKKDISIDLLQSADLFIYQPVREEHGIYSTDHVLSYLRDSCRQISFPYLYNDALWPLFRDEKRIVNASAITDLLESGASVVEIAVKFLSLQIDFQFQNRFQNTLQILGEKEAATTVKARQYILENYKAEKLFLTHNHPSSQLLVYCANQVLSILQYPLLKKGDHPHPNEAQLPGYFPISPYEKAHYQLSYEDNWSHFYEKKGQNNWRRLYLLRIMEICLNRHKENKVKYHLDKVTLKLFRSLVKYLPIR